VQQPAIVVAMAWVGDALSMEECRPHGTSPRWHAARGKLTKMSVIKNPQKTGLVLFPIAYLRDSLLASHLSIQQTLPPSGCIARRLRIPVEKKSFRTNQMPEKFLATRGGAYEYLKIQIRGRIGFSAGILLFKPWIPSAIPAAKPVQPRAWMLPIKIHTCIPADCSSVILRLPEYRPCPIRPSRNLQHLHRYRR
jgi:hypothetical protein